MIDGKEYKAHRLAWLYVYGIWPKLYIDHINGIRDDNRICNLRDVSNRENAINRSYHRKGKLAGASYHKQKGKWRATIRINGRYTHLGLFETKEEAHLFYMKKKEDIDKESGLTEIRN